jgi:sec-independent protein translocase protein TatA
MNNEGRCLRVRAHKILSRAQVSFRKKEVVMFEGLFQPMHLLVILFIALMVFGPKKLPELGKGLGDGIRSFKDSMRERQESLTKAEDVATSEVGAEAESEVP